ncbi:MAG: hypothetical protein WDW38_010886 [Sanguina aurantia]
MLLSVLGCFPTQAFNMRQLHSIPAPTAKQVSYMHPAPGGRNEPRSDPFNWLADRSCAEPEVLRYLHAENQYAAQQLQDTRELQSRMLAECAGRTPEVEKTAGRLVGAHWYYSQRGPGQQYWVQVRRAAAPLDDSQIAEVVLDPNQLAAAGQHDYLDMGDSTVRALEQGAQCRCSSYRQVSIPPVFE